MSAFVPVAWAERKQSDPPARIGKSAKPQAAGVRVTRKEKLDKALQLRLRGLSYRQIAAEFGCAVNSAVKLVKDAVSQIPRESPEMVRRLELLRLYALWQAIFPKAAAGDRAAIDCCLRISALRLRRSACWEIR